MRTLRGGRRREGERLGMEVETGAIGGSADEEGHYEKEACRSRQEDYGRGATKGANDEQGGAGG
eukprot:8519084-Pyramimonas_sp.AAC.1